MRLAPMRFRGLSLNHNPQTLTVNGRANVRELISPCCEPDSEALGLRLRVVSGEGELYGEDCLEQYRKLEQLMAEQLPGWLMLLDSEPLYAYLSELRLTAPPVDGVVQYRFMFTQAKSPHREKTGAEYYITETEGESLWDICYSFKADIGAVVALNPQIKFIDSLKMSERVRLC